MTIANDLYQLEKLVRLLEAKAEGMACLHTRFQAGMDTLHASSFLFHCVSPSFAPRLPFSLKQFPNETQAGLLSTAHHAVY